MTSLYVGLSTCKQVLTVRVILICDNSSQIFIVNTYSHITYGFQCFQIEKWLALKNIVLVVIGHALL